MKIIKHALLAILITGGLSSIVSAEMISHNPFVSVDYKYYTVSGNSVSAIRASIKNRSTAKWGNRKRISYSDIKSSTRYQYTSEYGTCKLYDGTNKTKIVQTLPKLKNPDKVNKNVRDKFNAYVESLKKYERNGIEFRIKAVKEVQSYFKRGPSFPCNKRVETIQGNTSKIYKKWNKQMSKYLSSTKQPVFR